MPIINMFVLIHAYFIIFLYSLRMLYTHIMNLVILLPLTLPRATPASWAPSNLMSFFFPPNNHCIWFVVLIYSCVWGHDWIWVNVPGTTSLKKTSSSPRSHQLSIAPQLGVGAFESLSPSC